MKSVVSRQSSVVSAAAFLLALSAGAYEHTWANMFFDTLFNSNAVMSIPARYIPDDTRWPTNGSGRVSERLKWGYLGSFSAYMERDLFSRSLFSGDVPKNIYDRLRDDPRYLVGGNTQDFLFNPDPASEHGGHMTAFRNALFVPGADGETTTSRVVKALGGRIMPTTWLDAICSQAHLVWNGTLGLGKTTFPGCFTGGAGWREIPWAENPAVLEKQYHWYSLLMPTLSMCKTDKWKTEGPSREHVDRMLGWIYPYTGLGVTDVFYDPSDPASELPVPAVDCSLYTNVLDIAGEKAAETLCDTNATHRLSYSQMAGVNAATFLAKSSWSMGLSYLPTHKESELSATNALFALRNRELEASAGGKRDTGIVVTEEDGELVFRLAAPQDPGYYAYDEYFETNSISEPRFLARHHNNPGCAFMTNALVESASLDAGGSGDIEFDPEWIYEDYTNTIYDLIRADLPGFPGTNHEVFAEIYIANGGLDYVLSWYVTTNGVECAGPFVGTNTWHNIFSAPDISLSAALEYGYKLRADWRYTETNGIVAAGRSPPAEYWASNIVSAVSLYPMWLALLDAPTFSRVEQLWEDVFSTGGQLVIDGAWLSSFDWRGICTVAGVESISTPGAVNSAWMGRLIRMNDKVKNPRAVDFFATRLLPEHDFGGDVRRPNFPDPAETLVLAAGGFAALFNAMQGLEIGRGDFWDFAEAQPNPYWDENYLGTNRVYLAEIDKGAIDENTPMTNIRWYSPEFHVGSVTDTWTIASRPEIAIAAIEYSIPDISEWHYKGLPYVTNKVEYCVPPFAIQTLPVDVEKVDWNFYNLRP